LGIVSHGSGALLIPFLLFGATWVNKLRDRRRVKPPRYFHNAIAKDPRIAYTGSKMAGGTRTTDVKTLVSRLGYARILKAQSEVFPVDIEKG
jgi:hypothetical protein